LKVHSSILALNNQQVREFKQFLLSSFFNNDQILVALLDLYSLHKNSYINKTLVWNKIFPKEDYNDSKLRQLNHKLLNQLKHYLCVAVMLKNDILQHRILASAARKNQLKALKNDLIKFDDKIFEDGLLQTEASVFDTQKAHDGIFRIEKDSERIKSFESKNTQERVLRSHELLKYSYQIGLIRNFLLLNNHKEVSNTQLFIDPSEIESNQLSFGKVPIYDLYKRVFDIYTNSHSSTRISQTLQQLSEFSSENDEELKSIYTYLINYLIRELNNGQAVDKEIYELTLLGIKRGFELNNGVIRSTSYMNIVVTASRLGKLKKALELSEQFSSLLAQEDRESVYSYTKASVYMRMKRYHEVVEVLSNVKYDTTGINLNSRLIQIMAFYELEEYEVLVSTIKAFKVFLRRSRKMPKARKQNFLDFCDVVFNLVQATEKSDPKRIAKAQTILDGNQAVPSTWWLKEKIEEASQLLGITSAEL